MLYLKTSISSFPGTDNKIKILGVLNPSDDPHYQKLLQSKWPKIVRSLQNLLKEIKQTFTNKDPERRRLCAGNKFVDSKCSYFPEFVVTTGG